MIEKIDWGSRQKPGRKYKGNQVGWENQQNQQGQNQNGGYNGNAPAGNQHGQNQPSQFQSSSVHYPPNYGGGAPSGSHYTPSGNHYPPNYGSAPTGNQYPSAAHGNPVPESNGYAVAGLILGLISLFIPFLGLLTAIPGLIISICGMKPPNKGMATAGLILSVFVIVIYLSIAIGTMIINARRVPLPF